MKNKTLYNIKHSLKTNKGGITINLNGNIANNKKGYYCSITNNTFKRLTNRDINIILKRARDIKHKNKVKTYLGYWCDKNNNHFLDISLRFLNRKKAFATGLKHNQQAVFNLNKMDTIYLKR